MSAFLDNFKKFLPIIELGVNVGLLASGLGAPFEPLAAGIEQAINPLINSAGTAQTTTTIEMSAYATIIGILTVMEQTPGLPTATLTEIQGYLTAAQAGVAGYVTAQTGFSLPTTLLLPPIA